MSRYTKTITALVFTASLCGLGTATAGADPEWLPEPTPVINVGSSNIGLCAYIPIWPWPVTTISVCI
ncbi:hypothetical protein [Antrihabitans sp. YC2-6]|uniref:hypothetical protein n=1 Tax=Antrihabitans sp. YC2-6 TaxID=2799498 RepID=UPI0018F4A72E|nr:hypothetical protein [Antrihabitans sp. YC2-6]MBJ8345797.1 hypothetical protein [Antrihabitans sp. YC2-6]